MSKTKQCFAHSLPERPESEWQPLEFHLSKVGEIARSFACDFDAGNWAYLSGLWHDIGKYSQEFQDYLRSGAEGAAESFKGQIDHSTAGAQHATKRVTGPYGRVLAYAIAGHHAGLPDAVGSTSSLEARIKKTVNDCSNAPKEIACTPTKLSMPLTKPEK